MCRMIKIMKKGLEEWIFYDANVGKPVGKNKKITRFRADALGDSLKLILTQLKILFYQKYLNVFYE